MKQKARRGAEEPAAETATRSDSWHRRAHRGPGSDHGLREPARAAAAVIMTTPASRRPCSMVSAPLPRTSSRAQHACWGLGARCRAPRADASGNSWALHFGPAGSTGSPSGSGSCASVPGQKPPAPGAAALCWRREPSGTRRSLRAVYRGSRPRVSEGVGATSGPRSVPSHAALGPLAQLPCLPALRRASATHGAGVGER